MDHEWIASEKLASTSGANQQETSQGNANEVLGAWYNAFSFEAAYVVPIVTLLGAISVVLTLICMPRSSIATKMKIFYVLGGALSGVTLIITQGLYYISGTAHRSTIPEVRITSILRLNHRSLANYGSL